jgi:hypothetical protein
MDMEILYMDAICNEIRKKLNRLGWNPKQREIETSAGDKIWVVFNKQTSRSFSTQAPTQRAAWESAWKLVGDIRKFSDEPQMILPFPANIPSYHRAA